MSLPFNAFADLSDFLGNGNPDDDKAQTMSDDHASPDHSPPPPSNLSRRGRSVENGIISEANPLDDNSKVSISSTDPGNHINGNGNGHGKLHVKDTVLKDLLDGLSNYKTYHKLSVTN